MKIDFGFRRRWMLAGLAAAVLIGDLAVRGAATTSVEFIYGIAGFALAHVFRTVGQLREARPDWRVALAAAIPLVAFTLVRLRPPVLPFPIEVKAERNLQSKSLKSYRDRFAPRKCLRTSLSEHEVGKFIDEIPLYAIGSVVGDYLGEG